MVCPLVTHCSISEETSNIQKCISDPSYKNKLTSRIFQSQADWAHHEIKSCMRPWCQMMKLRVCHDRIQQLSKQKHDPRELSSGNIVC